MISSFAKFGVNVDLINIYNVTSCKTKGPFLACAVCYFDLHWPLEVH